MSPEWSPESIRSTVVVVSDRVLSGEKEDKAGPGCVRRLAGLGMPEPRLRVVAESRSDIEREIAESLRRGDRLVLILGGSGFREGNDAPEAARAFIDVEIPGIAEQIRAYGLAKTPLASLSRGVVGVSARNRTGALIVVSSGGAQDTLDVVEPLVPHILAQLDEA
mgnify:FL=1